MLPFICLVHAHARNEVQLGKKVKTLPSITKREGTCNKQGNLQRPMSHADLRPVETKIGADVVLSCAERIQNHGVLTINGLAFGIYELF